MSNATHVTHSFFFTDIFILQRTANHIRARMITSLSKLSSPNTFSEYKTNLCDR